VQRIQKYGLRHVSGYEPNKIPKEQVWRVVLGGLFSN
jgi:hypothetical protein